MLALAHILARHPAKGLAIGYNDQRWTFADLDARSDVWARWLVGQGVGVDTLVAFCRPNGPEFLALTFGIYKAGATPAPISHKLPMLERDAILAVMQPALFVDQDAEPTDDPAPLPTHIAASWKACTSGGSTGTPKVIVDARPAGFADGTEFIGIPAASVAFVPGPLYHNAPFSAAVFALWRGSSVVIADKFDEEAALNCIARHRVNWALMVPTMMRRIMGLPPEKRDAFDLSSWSMVVHTAAAMPVWLKQAWIEWRGANHIWEVYGATEGLVRCWIGGQEWLERTGSVGKPIGGAQVRILDAAGVDLPIGEEGEIYAMPPGGPESSYRYIGANRRATHDGWESVGDIGRLDKDGFLYLSDRRTDLIISGGVNIWPAEVEAAILRHPDILSCAVMGVADDDLGQIAHSIIETTDPMITVETLSAFLLPYLSRQKHPRSIFIQTTPVRDDAGKFRKSRSQI